MEPIIHFTKDGQPVLVGFQVDGGHLHNQTRDFLVKIEAGNFCLADLHGTKRQIARGFITKVLCGKNGPIICNDCRSKILGAYHLHHVAGEDSGVYRSLHTRQFIREYFQVLCPRCHAVHHGNWDIAQYDGFPEKKKRIDIKEKLARARILAMFTCVKCGVKMKRDYESAVPGICIPCEILSGE